MRGRGFLQYCNTAKKYCSTALPSTAVPMHIYCYYAVQHVSQAPHGRAKCAADPHARRRPKQEVWPQRIIAKILRACGIQTDRRGIFSTTVIYEYTKESSLASELTGVSNELIGINGLTGCKIYTRTLSRFVQGSSAVQQASTQLIIDTSL